jgi:hypothetical protein
MVDRTRATNLLLEREPFKGSVANSTVSLRSVVQRANCAYLGICRFSPGDDIISGSTPADDSLTLVKSVSSSSPSWTVPGSVTLMSEPRLSNSIPFWDRRLSYFLRRSTRSRSAIRFLRLRGGCGGTTRHSTLARTQLEQGLLLSQRTLRCWHKRHECPRVTFTALAKS